MCNKVGRMVWFALCALVICVDVSAAETRNFVSTGRYTEVSTIATTAQIDPLSSLITITIPSEISTVSQAMEYVLQRSGWRLTPYSEEDVQTQTLFELPLPTVHRRLGPISLREALETLAGKPFVMVEDPVRRSVGFTYAANSEKKTEKRKTLWGG